MRFTTRLQCLLSHAALGSAVLLAGCGGGGGGGGGGASAPIGGVSAASIRFVHASADTGAIDARVNGSLAASNIAARQQSGSAIAAAGTSTLQVSPAGNATPIVSGTTTLASGLDYVAVLVGNSAPGTPAAQAAGIALLEDSGAAPSAGNVKLRTVHGAPAVGALDVYLSAPGAALPAAPTIPNIAFRQASSGGEFGGGTYRVRIATQGTNAIVYDSGSVTFAAGGDLTIVAIPTTGSASPITLLVAPKGSATYELPDQRSAGVRIGHFAPNAGAIDLYFRESGLPIASNNRIGTAVAFNTISFDPTNVYQRVLPGSYRSSLTATGNTSALADLDFALAGTGRTTVLAFGLNGAVGAQGLRFAEFVDDLTPPAAGRAKVRFVNTVPDQGVAGPVDFVQLTAGAITATLAANVAYGAASSYVELTPGAYVVAVVPAGAGAPILPAGGSTLNVAAGENRVVGAIGCVTQAGACAGGSALSIVTWTN
jgi:trimeric autotransporter adhesin